MAVYRPPHLRRAAYEQASSPTVTDAPSERSELDEPEPMYGQTEDARIGAIAIAEKRRLYVGNMPYFAKEVDVRALFEGRPVERISIAIDPFTGRNPSYCFVDVATAADAERAIAELSGRDLLGRPVRVGLGTPHRLRGDGSFTKNARVERLPGRGRVWDKWQKGEQQATSHFNYAGTGARVFVGNLPGFSLDPARVDAEIKDFFQGFEILAISKIIRPRAADSYAAQDQSIGHYVFVDLASTNEADRAVRTLHGAWRWGRTVKVSLPRQQRSWKVEERDKYLAQRSATSPR
ncbi:putative RNA recognition motif containing protein [Lyophyllum shimeji]|uniref:RNA recognition motif containing protein n=1 Tax=Lyophyllum shimeji TaxID=47721 RepID=A0A9P3PIJ4_LYOSH|nr:putative RNA recognition motif containing protein [Lyophyllum shimeji]